MSAATFAPTMAAFPKQDQVPTGAILRLVDVPIEDVRQHGEAAVARLRAVLRAGTQFVKDRRHARRYEIATGGERFYIHVLRGAAKVLLLARWKE